MTTSDFTPAARALIAKEAADCGFDTNIQRFLECQAGIRRLDICYRAGNYDGRIAHEEWEQFGEHIAARLLKAEVSFGERGHTCYEVFGDGSLYIHSNADDVVWADALDFVYRELLECEANWNQEERELFAYFEAQT